MLENQLELLSEKMYGSPAKSAARERDRLQIELERERTGRLSAEETIHALHVQLERAHARVAELMTQLAAEESARADLERTRRALHAAHTNVALGLMGKNQQRHMYNPIAAPRHQFGLSSASANGSGRGPMPAGGSQRAKTSMQRSSSTPRAAPPTR